MSVMSGSTPVEHSGSSFRLLSQLSIRVRIVLIAIIPSLAVLWFVCSDVMANWAERERLQQSLNIVSVAGAVGDLVTALQREAGASATFASSRGKDMRTELRAARSETDVAIKKLKATIASAELDKSGASAARAYATAEKNIDMIDAKRSAVDSNSIALDELNDYYTFGLIGNSLNVVEQTLPLIRKGELQIIAQTYESIVWLKEMSGAARANAVVGFASGSFPMSLLSRVAGFQGKQALYKTRFDLFASPDQQSFYNRVVTGPEVSRVEAVTKEIADASSGTEFASKMNPQEWIDITSARIAMLGKVETKIRDDLVNTAKSFVDSASWSIAWSLAVGVLAVVGTLILVFFIGRSISQPLSSLGRMMTDLGAGRLDTRIDYVANRDEIGDMARSLELFKEALIAKKAADEAAAADAQGKIERGRRIDALTRDFEAMIGKVVQTVSSASSALETSAVTLSSAAETAQEVTKSVALASEQASTNVQSVASASEELSSSVGEIGRQVQETARMASAAVDQARRTNDQVSELARAASRIGDVVELINTIAGQTNLLALNATIEAARAGEAGRGFAVVATEVKALAEQTAKATGEIGLQVASIQSATQDSVSAIKDIGTTIERLSEISSAIAAAVEEQGAATQEISRNVQRAAQGTREVSSSIVNVQRGATDTGAASSQVLSAAKSLAGDSTRLKVEVEKFLTSVRVA